ncbi:hypothetical protein SCOR_18350 [Sulfidibacter corallicola]|uniref:6-bladed beta-propeller n=1 Tax=Sulfidibacter corallicola TaxID=2818388 RepID=A0A8A4TWN1_SULCO|nr:BF3164 family lipoprotein [Sulfidibacter corallicola]QTD53588.1 hypothetical protein J3U87_14125 [Sulfidibacter corallicola]
MLLFLLFTFLPASNGISFDDPQLIIKREANLSQSGNGLESPIDISLTPSGFAYVLDARLRLIHKYSLEGKKILSFGGKGEGPGEFLKPCALISVGSDIWVLDRDLARVTIFKKDKYYRSFKVIGIFSPESMVLRGDSVFIFGTSIFKKAQYHIYNTAGELLKRRAWPTDFTLKNGPQSGIWNSIEVEPLVDKGFLVGYTFYNAVGMIDDSGNAVRMKNMEDYYDRYEGKGVEKGFPDGFSASAFAQGPDGTVFVATCSQKEHTCGELFQLTQDLGGIVSKNTFGGSVRKIRYFPHFNFLIVIVGGSNEVLFYIYPES